MRKYHTALSSPVIRVAGGSLAESSLRSPSAAAELGDCRRRRLLTVPWVGTADPFDYFLAVRVEEYFVTFRLGHVRNRCQQKRKHALLTCEPLTKDAVELRNIVHLMVFGELDRIA